MTDVRPDTETPLAWAYRYAQRGMAAFPVNGVLEDGSCACGDPHDGTRAGYEPKNVGKHPVLKESFAAASTDLAVLERWFANGNNVAVATGARSGGLLVIDVDGPDGEAELAALEAEHGPLPPTLQSRTGRPDGGRHLVFQVPSGQELPGRKLADHIDCRGRNGYIVVCPSKHRSGAHYTWENWPARPAELPRWVAERLAGRRHESRRHGPQPAPLTDQDLEHLPAELRARLLAPAKPSGDRSEEQFNVVRALVAAGVDDRTIRSAMQRNPTSVARGDIDRHVRVCIDKIRSATTSFEQTDVGNAERLLARHSQRFRHVGAWGTWLVWDGRRWLRDDNGAVVEAAKAVARDMLTAGVATPDADERKRAVSWALRTQAATRIAAMIQLARSDPRVAVSPDELDADPWLLNAANGTIDLRTGQLRPHDPADLLTKLAPVDYHPDATAPTFAAFLEQVLPDEGVREFTARWFGYCLTGDISEHKLLTAYGTGANGKTTLTEAFSYVLGDYAEQAEPDLLLARRDTHPTGVARLHGARFVVSAEVGQGRRLAEDVVKRLTGGDRITARFMRADFFEFDPTHKLVLVVNHRPEVRGTDHAIWRRIRVLPFAVTIPDDHQDPDLPARLRTEGPGILAWAVAGCRRWQQEGLTEPLAVQLATADYRAANDTVGHFIDECFKLEARAETTAKAIREAYLGWCEANGEHPVSQTRLGEALAERGHERRKSNGVRWLGLRLTWNPREFQTG